MRVKGTQTIDVNKLQYIIEANELLANIAIDRIETGKVPENILIPQLTKHFNHVEETRLLTQIYQIRIASSIIDTIGNIYKADGEYLDENLPTESEAENSTTVKRGFGFIEYNPESAKVITFPQEMFLKDISDFHTGFRKSKIKELLPAIKGNIRGELQFNEAQDKQPEYETPNREYELESLLEKAFIDNFISAQQHYYLRRTSQNLFIGIRDYTGLEGDIERLKNHITRYEKQLNQTIRSEEFEKSSQIQKKINYTNISIEKIHEFPYEEMIEIINKGYLSPEGMSMMLSTKNHEEAAQDIIHINKLQSNQLPQYQIEGKE